MTTPGLPVHPEDILEAIDVSAGKQLGVDVRTLKPDQNLFDLGLTSIGFISMIVEFEQRYNIVFEEDELDLTEFSTFEAIMAQLERKLAGLDDARVRAATEG